MTVADLFALRPRIPAGTASFRRHTLSCSLTGNPFLRCDTDERRASDSFILCISGKHCHHTMEKISCQSKYKKSAKAACIPPLHDSTFSLFAYDFLQKSSQQFRRFHAHHANRHSCHLPCFPTRIKSQPSKISAAPPRAAHAHPGMHKKISSNPKLISAVPITVNNPSCVL